MLIKNLDNWDRREFNDAMQYDPEMATIEKDGSRKAFNFSEFMLDTFGGLYKYAPEVAKEEEIPAEGKWAKSIYDEISQLQEWKNLRERTRMNPEAAAAATAKFCGQFMDSLPNSNSTPNLQGGEPVNVGNGVPNPNILNMSAIRKAARDACQAAADEADKTNEMIGAFGYGNENGRPQYASPTLKREVAAKLATNDTLQRIAELAGRMRRIAAEKQKEKTRHGVDELADIMIGDDLARLVPSELCKLAHPLMKKDFQKRYLEKQLVQYRLRGKEKKGRGPIIICIDESGSMQGDKDVWAKAVAMALLQVAQVQRRAFAIVHFDSKVTRTDKWKHGKVDPTELMDSMQYFTGGGTNYMNPLNEAVQIIEADSQKEGFEFKDADIVFVTDGDCTITDDFLRLFNEAKARANFKVISVLIGVGKSVLDYVSDQVFNLDNIREADGALDAMFTV
jgi:uncharacterized protein with von Willebrand factor type A (vWA) domain